MVPWFFSHDDVIYSNCFIKAELDGTTFAYNYRMQPVRVSLTTRRKSELHAYDLLPTTRKNRMQLTSFLLKNNPFQSFCMLTIE